MIPWLRSGDPFPRVETALESPNGLLAASSQLDADRLLMAYRRGIFPWFSEGDPVLWWSPDPRMVLFTTEFQVARSLRKRSRSAARSEELRVSIDLAFMEIIRGCAAPRSGQQGTWITPTVVAAYTELHRRGHAHSVEVWRMGQLVGGLYGVAIGRAFFGESMFSREPDASKLALAALVALLRLEQVRVIDCQQKTRHLASLGAREIPRGEFCGLVLSAAAEPAINWRRYAGTRNDLLSGY
jgi:leucyl/phenylalanyl-tRNA--protein transferase